MEPLRERRPTRRGATRLHAPCSPAPARLRGPATPLTGAPPPELGCRLAKREDLNHTGAHKVNNTVGQALLAKRMGKPRVIAETGAGQHGVASATVCALLGLECVVYMGTEDMARQAPNVRRMRMLGAEVRGVDSGARTLKDAINEAMRDWSTNVRTRTTCWARCWARIRTMMVRDFQASSAAKGAGAGARAVRTLPDLLVASVGGGSNAIGSSTPSWPIPWPGR